MIINSLLSVGAFSLAAQAFLVIPENIDLPTETTAVGEYPAVNSVFDAQDVKLDCSSCPFALESTRNGRHEWTNDVQSDLEMTISTDGQTLKFNDVPFYPLPQGSPPNILFVKQTKKGDEESAMKGFEGNLRISYSVEFSEKKTDDGNSLVSIVMTIMGLDGQMVRPDSLEITAVKAADGQVSLPLSLLPLSEPHADMQQLSLSSQVLTLPSSPDAPDAKCANILCRVFTKLIVGVHKAKASAAHAGHRMKCLCVKCMHKIMGHKGLPHHHVSPVKGDMPVPFRRPDGTLELPSHVVFKPAGHHGHAHHHHHHKGFLRQMSLVMATAVKVVFVPILIGVAFGMAASAIGMLAGQAIVFLWMKFRRAPENGAYECVETDEKEAPPAYQDVQVEAINEKEIDAKA